MWLVGMILLFKVNQIGTQVLSHEQKNENYRSKIELTNVGLVRHLGIKLGSKTFISLFLLQKAPRNLIKKVFELIKMTS